MLIVLSQPVVSRTAVEASMPKENASDNEALVRSQFKKTMQQVLLLELLQQRVRLS